jgi:hypothetical protein
MGKVVFSIRYEVLEDKLEDYFDVIRELKNIITAEELEEYKVYKVQGKKNQYVELYTFANQEAYDNFDDDPDERVDILMSKLSDLLKPGSSEYLTLSEI